MILAIISHTEHFRDASGQIVGWGATVRELNHLTEIFEKVIHVACLHDGLAPAGVLPYESPNIEFVPLKPFGGERAIDKLSVVSTMPHNIRIVKSVLRRCDVFQFRAPTGMGVYMIPYLLSTGKKGWFKYAGNWVEENPPLGYRVQRFFLKHQNNRIVTINGRWPDQKPNQLTFENPCLTQEERTEGHIIVKEKSYCGKMNFVFVGRLEDAKGVQRILNVFSKIDSDRIGTIHFIGDGEKKEHYRQFAADHCKQHIVFHGFLKRTEVNAVLEQSHVFLLPSSASEGFPKVIAEATNYGLIPIVSDVSSIGQYIIDDKTGFIVHSADETILYDRIMNVLNKNEASLRIIAEGGYAMSERFTYDFYNKRIMNDILEKLKQPEKCR